MSLESALLACISVLSTVLTVIAKLLWSEVSDCKKDRVALRDEIEKVREQVGELKGRQTAYQACPLSSCPFRPSQHREP